MQRILAATLCSAMLLSACDPVNTKSPDAVIIASDDLSMLNLTVQNWIAETNFNGIVATGKNAEVTYVSANGVADHQTGRMLSDQSVFQTGSIDKLFASIVAFALVDKQQLDLDAPITDYLPDDRLETGSRITLADLLANRSGLPASFRPVFGQMMQGLKADPDASLASLGLDMTLAVAVKTYGQGELTAEPGTTFDYVYANWVVVHDILETVTGQSYGDLLDEYVFQPSGANRSGVFDMNLDPAEVGDGDIAIGYDADDDFHKGDFPIPPMLGGGSYSSAGDMIRILDSLYNGTLLSAESMDRFSTVTTDDENYAYGGRLMTYRSAPDELYSWQSGSNGATNVVAVRAIKGDYGFVTMSNTANSQDDMFSLSRTLEDMIKE